MTATRTGKQIVLETFAAEGVRRVFGNPGTTELPLIDGLVDYPAIEYVLALHEAVAVSMADACAHASGEVAVVNLHVGPGLGNGLGSLYNAFERHTPLLVTAGQQDSRMRLREPLLAHDLVAMAAPLTKWSVEARSADELPLLLNRAFKIAREAPSGPVFVSLPMDVMEQRTAHGPLAPSRIHARVHPDPEGIAAAAARLATARSPAIVCGDRVAESAGVAALVALAERLGAPVWSEVLPARLDFPVAHDLFRDRIANDQAAIRDRLAPHDVVLLVGGEFFEEIWHADEWPFADGATLVQLDDAPSRIGRNYPVHVGLVGDVRLGLEDLIRAMESCAEPGLTGTAAGRRETIAAEKSAAREQQTARAGADPGNRPMSTARLMRELAAGVPAGTAVAGEAITATPDLMRSFDFREPGDYLAARGGGIGQGLPSAIGLKLAAPERPVLCVSGDGSALYTAQALWTAAHHRIAVVWVVIDNGGYRILKINMDRYRREAGIALDRPAPHLDLDEPVIDFVRIAEGFGVGAERIEDPEAIGPALRGAFAAEEPRLLSVRVDGSIPG